MLDICTKFRENILNGIKVMHGEMLFILKMTKGYNSVKEKKLSYANCLVMHYISTKFCKKSQRLSELLSKHDFHTEIYTGA